MFAVVILSALCAINLIAQAARSSVTASEVNGTFRSYFKGKFKGSFNEIKILSVGRGKVKIAMDLTYPYTYGKGELMANTGQLEGVAEISDDTAVYSSEEFGSCKITIKFVRPGTISVDEEGTNCGFGHNVTAGGTYKKVSAAKPRL